MCDPLSDFLTAFPKRTAMKKDSPDLDPVSREKKLTKAEEQLAGSLGAVLAKWWAVDGQTTIPGSASPVTQRITRKHVPLRDGEQCPASQFN